MSQPRKTTICLSVKTLLFYAVLTPVIAAGSAYNLIYGLVLGRTPTVEVGAFGLFGFILLPVLLLASYRRNRCVLEADRVTIGKTVFPFSAYNFEITEQHLAFKDRPLFSLLRSKYPILIITRRSSGKEALTQELDVFAGGLAKLKAGLPQPLPQAMK